ncbi:predicted protein [Fibroporia radiculosa]|nr:predicted protein [Fibroporia radiculosa]
MSALHVP